jgi:hypothetical protein
MQKRISGKLCDTETATKLGNIAVGEYGNPAGYEEILFINGRKQHFLYGNGGATSKYTKPTMVLLTDEQAAAWCKENNIAIPKLKAASPSSAKAKTPVKQPKTAKKNKTSNNKKQGVVSKIIDKLPGDSKDE